MLLGILAFMASIYLIRKTEFGRYKLEENVRVEKRFLMPDVQVYEKMPLTVVEKIGLFMTLPASLFVIWLFMEM